jgi:hypothetical protein
MATATPALSQSSPVRALMSPGDRPSRKQSRGARRMKLVEFVGAKGAALWISSAQVTHIQGHAAGEGSMYGSSNERAGARVFLTGGLHLDVRQTVAEAVALFAA